MKTTVLVLLLAFVWACDTQNDTDLSPDVRTEDAVTAPADVPPDTWSEDVQNFGPPPAVLGSDERPAAVTVPSDYDTGRTWPLVLLLHGYQGTGFQVDPVFLQLSIRIDEYGFVLVLPEGSVDEDGDQFWNATPACCDMFDAGVDDVGYLLGLVDEARTAMPIDHVVVVGYSNGAFMAHRLACEGADRIDGIAALAGVTFLDESLCTPSRPVSVLQIHGTADPTIAYAGGTYDDRLAAHPGAEETVARWRALNGCAETFVEGELRDYDAGVFGPETTPFAWTDCDEDSRVDLWSMDGSTHAPGPTHAFRDDLMDYLLSTNGPAR